MENIKQILPHRYPFLFIDKITEQEHGKWVKGYKLLSLNEWNFDLSEFPMIIPHSYILESLAQISAFVFPEEETSIGLLSSMRDITFTNSVYPGDRVDLYFAVIKKTRKMLKGIGIAKIDGKQIVKAEQMIIIYPN